MDPNQRPVVRKPSTKLRSYISRTTSTRTPRPSPQSLPLSSNRHTSAGLRSLVTRFRDIEPEFEMLTPPRTASPPTRKLPALPISPLTKAFVNALTVAKLSDFLVWMLYYDIAELPQSAESWYKDLGGLDMRGWVALGAHLKKTKTTGYGFDLIVLDSVCDRLRLERAIVHSFLIKFADPGTMRFSTLARVVEDGLALRKSELETLDTVQAHLHTLNRLAACLTPNPESHYVAWHAIVQKRIQGFLHLVVGPRIAQRREGTPLVTAGTSEHLPQKVRDGIQLNYVYEALLQERVVPLWRYGGEKEETTPPSSPPSVNTKQPPGRTEQLIQENSHLRSQIATLQAEKHVLTQDRRKLVTQLATMHTLHSDHDEHSNDNTRECWSWNSPASESPRDTGTPRSISPTPFPRARQLTTALSNKYADVFSGLDEAGVSPSPARLSDSLSHSPKDLVSLSTRSGVETQVRSRRSGRVFDVVDLAFLKDLGEEVGTE